MIATEYIIGISSRGLMARSKFSIVAKPCTDHINIEKLQKRHDNNDRSIQTLNKYSNVGCYDSGI